MTIRRALVRIGSKTTQLPSGDMLDKSTVGLGLVDNTADKDKPVSDATATALSGKVDKVAGKVLSTEDFTAAEKNKLGGIEAGAQVNVPTNLSSTVNGVTYTINSSTGQAVVIAAATSSAAGVMTAAQVTKLNGIAAGATANSTDAILLSRANHTGTQAISTIVNLQTTLDTKVDKLAGYGLSETSFTAAEKAKLAGLDPNHYRGTFTNLSSLNSGVSSPVAGDYADVDASSGNDVQRYIWDVNDSKWVAQSGTVSALTAAQVKALYESNADTNAFTNAYKSKVDGIAAGATANPSTSSLAEGTNLYFTSSRVLSTVLAGLSLVTGTAVAAADSLLVAIGKLQKQITDLGSSKLDASANAVSATKLATARTINGVAFDGTGNIAVTATDSTKEPAISNGSTAQFWRGDKTWQDFATTVRASALSGLSTSTATAVVAADTVLAAAGKLQAQINTLSSGKEPSITAGTATQFWAGDKSWSDFSATTRAVTLTGLSYGDNSRVTASDTVLSALGKLQSQIKTVDNLDAWLTWQFATDTNGWVATGSTLTWSTNKITQSSTGGDPYITSPAGLGIVGKTYDKVRMRITRVAGTGWDGTLYYTGTGPAHTISSSYRKTIDDPKVGVGETQIIEFDMTQLTAGGTDWTNNTIGQLRIDLGSTAADQFDIDWIAVGRYGPTPQSPNLVSVTQLSGPYTTSSVSGVKLGSLSCTIVAGNNPVEVSYSLVVSKAGTAANAGLAIRRNGTALDQPRWIIPQLDQTFNYKQGSFIDTPGPGTWTYEFYWNVESASDTLSTVSGTDSRFNRNITAKEIFS